MIETENNQLKQDISSIRNESLELNETLYQLQQAQTFLTASTNELNASNSLNERALQVLMEEEQTLKQSSQFILDMLATNDNLSNTKTEIGIRSDNLIHYVASVKDLDIIRGIEYLKTQKQVCIQDIENMKEKEPSIINQLKSTRQHASMITGKHLQSSTNEVETAKGLSLDIMEIIQDRDKTMAALTSNKFILDDLIASFEKNIQTMNSQIRDLQEEEKQWENKHQSFLNQANILQDTLQQIQQSKISEANEVQVFRHILQKYQSDAIIDSQAAKENYQNDTRFQDESATSQNDPKAKHNALDSLHHGASEEERLAQSILHRMLSLDFI